jgi:coenzyme F420-0:L-glutamate ligase / coenzyme F420-1:gamma-L-glutamate ligase
MITIFAPDGIGEVAAGADLAALVIDSVGRQSDGPLQDGDIVVITSKIVSKAEGRRLPATERREAIATETERTVAYRDGTRIVRTRTGLTIAAAGVDRSNIDRTSILLLPADPDASAGRLRDEVAQRTGRTVGVIISDTAGRPWRVGQTDHAIGAAGVRVVERFAGQNDHYGNALFVTAIAVADEIAAAAELAKGKLDGRPLAVVRGLSRLVVDIGENAHSLLRDPPLDLFAYGTREAVLAAALAATGQQDCYEGLVGLEQPELVEQVLAGSGLSEEAADLLRRMLTADLGSRR